MIKIIGIAGPKGVGKTTVGCELSRLLPTTLQISFADPLKDMLAILLEYGGIDDPRDLMSDPIRKEERLDILQGHTPRECLQTLGTEWGRDRVGINLWTSICMTRIERSNAQYAIVDDVRFPSEVAAIADRKGVVFKLRREDVKQTYEHDSEQDLPILSISNNRDPKLTAGELYKKLLVTG